MKRKLWRFLIGFLIFITTLFGLAWWSATPDIGAVATGQRLERISSSPQWDGEGFANRLTRIDGSALEMMGKGFGGSPKIQRPEQPLPVVSPDPSELATPPESGLRVTWLGHSTLLVDIDGIRVLIDPVWGHRTSPWSSVGPARFYPPPLPLEDLPQVDVVIISHDHYDHLDYPTVSRLSELNLRWLVPLGIGAHLEHWGVNPSSITELDWWESASIDEVTLTATPARHFSGRWIDRMDSTLWAGWSIRGPVHAAFYSGDTALHPEFEEIGRRLGPFDITMMESGAYDSTWTDVHLGPEQAVIAHQMVGGGLLLPVHWGLFDLANHGWSEPMERLLSAAERQGVNVISPRPGESVELTEPHNSDRWWPETSQTTVENGPVWSTSIDDTLRRWWGTD